ncbi:MAG: class I SAM-dependent methyltransferase [Candidatus Hermodarchaeota archaeon]
MNIFKTIIDILNLNFPKSIQLIEAILSLNFTFFAKPMNHRFSTIYIKNIWGSKESKSGKGSILNQTATIRREIPQILGDIKAATLLDLPCGDFNWLQHVDLGLKKYIGGDIVPEIVAQNRKKYENDKRIFKLMDITTSKLPKVDIILCRDCLVHLSYKDIFAAINNFKRSKSTYLLSTTFVSRRINRNIFTGGWRPINLQKSPFNFPPAIYVINEHCTEANGRMADKSLGLWKIEDIPIR